MIANQSNIVSLRGYYRKKSLKASPPPDLSLACVSPYAAQAGCGRQTCSYREGTRSSPRSSHGGTWCAPWGTSGACSPGRSRGRSAVGRRHLEFQVAGLRPGTGGERQAKRSARQWQLMGLLPRPVWEESLQSAAQQGWCFQTAANRTARPAVPRGQSPRANADRPCEEVGTGPAPQSQPRSALPLSKSFLGALSPVLSKESQSYGPSTPYYFVLKLNTSQTHNQSGSGPSLESEL